MTRGFDSAYAYARVCGALARSFLGERAAGLAKSARVGEAWRSIFEESPPVLPEGELAAAAERRIRSRARTAVGGIAGDIALEEPFFAALLRKGEFTYLQLLLAAVVERAAGPPHFEPADFKPEIDIQAFPDLGAMLRGTRYRWVNETALGDLPAIKNRLDRQYYAELWESRKTVAPRLLGSIPRLLRIEAELENLAWGFRLKRYYSMEGEDIEGLLIELKGCNVRGPTMRAIMLRADSRAEWALWKWERLLPDSRNEAGGEWYLDLRRFEAAARVYLIRLLYRRLHLEPDTFVPLYAYYRIKEFETRAIHGVIEGLRLEAPATEIGAFASETTGGSA